MLNRLIRQIYQSKNSQSPATSFEAAAKAAPEPENEIFDGNGEMEVRELSPHEAEQYFTTIRELSVKALHEREST